MFELPEPSCGIGPADNCLVFNDATVFSLALLDFNDPTSPTYQNPAQVSTQGPWYVKSTTGSGGLEDKITITSAPAEENNPKNLSDNEVCTGNCDDAYNSPNDAPGGNTSAYFAMIPPDPGPSGTWDNKLQSASLLPNPDGIDIDGDGSPDGSYSGQMPLWDIPKDDLLAYIDAPGNNQVNDVVFGFALNETNPECTPATITQGCQDSLAWATVYLTDAAGNILHEYILNGENTTPGVPGMSYAQDATNSILPDSGQQDPQPWSFVHGRICVDSDGPTAGAVLGLGPCNQAQSQAGGKTVNQSLGKNQAAFLIYDEDLNYQLRNDASVAHMTVDFRMAYIDNGTEALFILPALVGRQVPEPTAMFLIGAGFIGLGITRRRRMKATHL